MKNKHLYLVLIMTCVLLTECKKSGVEQSLNSQEFEEIVTPQVKSIQEEKNHIIEQNPEYINYKEYSFQLGNSYIVVYEPPEANKDEFLEYYVDIWTYSKDGANKIEEKVYVLSDTFGIETIDGREYFRYDKSYVTGSSTEMVMLDEQGEIHQISLPGALSEVNGSDLTIIVSHYDMVYVKTDLYSCGHTWKPYYYHLKDYDVVEYKAYEIEKEEFLTYVCALDIVEEIMANYSKPEKKLSMKFFKRENGLIHINIILESADDFTYYYETYRIQENQSLEKIDSGEGMYLVTPSDEVYARYGDMDEVKQVYVISYSDTDNSIVVQNTEWLSPWREEDKSRIRELLDEGEISIEEFAWESEYYIYEKPGDTKTYQLANDVKIVPWAYDGYMKNEWIYYDVSKLNDIIEGGLYTIYVKEGVVYLINEDYMG